MNEGRRMPFFAFLLTLGLGRITRLKNYKGQPSVISLVAKIYDKWVPCGKNLPSSQMRGAEKYLHIPTLSKSWVQSHYSTISHFPKSSTCTLQNLRHFNILYFIQQSLNGSQRFPWFITILCVKTATFTQHELTLSPSPFLKMISLFWNSSSDMMSGFSQFNHSGLFADDIIRHSSSL